MSEQANKVASTDFESTLIQYFRSGYPILYIPTSEERRVMQSINNAAQESNSRVVTWDVAYGLMAGEVSLGPETRSPYEALKKIYSDPQFDSFRHLFVFKDLDDFWQDPSARRMIRSCVHVNNLTHDNRKRHLIILSSKLNIHEKLKECMTVVEFSLPNKKALKVLQKGLISQCRTSKREGEFDPVYEDHITQALLGLTLMEAENVLSRSIVKWWPNGEKIVQEIYTEKAAIIKKSEVLTYIPEANTAKLDEIGGFETVIQFIKRRAKAYTEAAQEQNIDYPKGIVLLGVPGTGKSLVAKAAGRILNMPVYTMNIGSVFGSLVGESEARMRDALRQVEAQQGCVLVLDEADKALGGAHNSQGDSGVTRRIFGQLLSWLNDKQDRTFVIMTMNRIDNIPPELLRAGRFDKVFYTDLPTEKERNDILRIHLRKRGVDVEQLNISEKDWEEVLKKTEGFVGSELEEVVREARYRALDQRDTAVPNYQELMDAITDTIPMITLDSEGVTQIREFCKKRAINVSATARKRVAKTKVRSLELDAE